MNGVIGEFRIGEDIALALDVESGDFAAVTAISAKMKRAKMVGSRLVLDDATPDIVMQAVAAGTTGWALSLGNSASAALAPGFYGIDARLSLAGAVEITDQTAFILLSHAAVA